MQRFCWYRNDGNFTFTRRVVGPNLQTPYESEVGDLNGDSIPEIIVVCSDTANTVAVYSSDGSEAYIEDIVYRGGLARDVEIGDWDGDSALDILVSLFNPIGNPENPIDVLLLKNDGTGGFNASPLITIAEKTNGIALKDVDADGDLDILIGFDSRRFDQPTLISVGINEGGNVNRIISLSGLEGGTVMGIDSGDLNGNGKG